MTTLTIPVRTTAAKAAVTVPTVHVRAVITWLAIFPMVAVGMTVMAPYSIGWPPVLRALALTAFVVPTAVYVVVPRLLAGYQWAARQLMK